MKLDYINFRGNLRKLQQTPGTYTPLVPENSNIRKDFLHKEVVVPGVCWIFFGCRFLNHCPTSYQTGSLDFWVHLPGRNGRNHLFEMLNKHSCPKNSLVPPIHGG